MFKSLKTKNIYIFAILLFLNHFAISFASEKDYTYLENENVDVYRRDINNSKEYMETIPDEIKKSSCFLAWMKKHESFLQDACGWYVCFCPCCAFCKLIGLVVCHRILMSTCYKRDDDDYGDSD